MDRAPILHVFSGARLAQPQQTRMSLCGWMSLQADALRLGQPRSAKHLPDSQPKVVLTRSIARIGALESENCKSPEEVRRYVKI